MQSRADASPAALHLQALQRRADAGVVQRAIQIDNKNNNSLPSESYASGGQSNSTKQLIKTLKTHFKTTQQAAGRGWQSHVIELVTDSGTVYNFDDLGDLAKHLMAQFPTSGKTSKEDPAFRTLIENYHTLTGKKHTAAPSRQAAGLEHLALHGSAQDKQTFLTMLKKPENQKGLIDHTRRGALNETLLTKQSVMAMQRSLAQEANVEPQAPADSGKDQVNWVRAQHDTSYPTSYFVFNNTSPDKTDSSKLIQDTHINADTFTEDAKGERTLTVGETSWGYHQGKTGSLDTNFRQSRHLKSWLRRNFKQHYKALATGNDILKTTANQRADQFFVTTGKKKLKLSDDDDLKVFAHVVDQRRDKVLTELFDYEKRIDDDRNTQYSESEIDLQTYPFRRMGIDETTDEEASQTTTKTPKKVKKSNATG